MRSLIKNMDILKDKSLIILAIETSCDETACAIVKNGRKVLSNTISSQINVHTLYGGVVPEIASRLHIENINACLRLALKDAGKSLKDIDVIAVTKGPGLVGALLVGVSEAKALSFALKKPIIGVNHIEGHIAANYISHPNLKPPYICLVVSGGHTDLIVVRDYTDFELVGSTQDDACGETFDKIARAIGLGYPGGPKIDEASKKGNPHYVEFPRAKVDGRPYDFSFSGLKSSVLNYINNCNMKGTKVNVPDICASFEAAVVESLVKRTISLAKEQKISTVALAGGVSANTALRTHMKAECEKNSLLCFFPDIIYCTDNAAMIGAAAYYEYISGAGDDESLNAQPDLKLMMRTTKGVAGENEPWL